MRRTIYIVDAMALAFRSFYAMGRSALTTSDGTPTGAVFGCAMFLNKLIAEQRPDYLVMVKDAPGKTFRDEMYAAYKATRDAMPDDLSRQLKFIDELYESMKIKVVSVPAVEADDVIATLARRHGGKDLAVYIVSGDKDFLQLVDGSVRLYAPKKNEEATIIDAAGVVEKTGVDAERIVDWLALVGDTVDNVPGVPGIGEKGAAKLLSAHRSLDGIYAAVDGMKPGKQRDNLIAHKEDAYLSQRLVTLKTDVNLPFGIDDLLCAADANANTELLAFYERFEFKTLANKTRKALAARGEEAPVAAQTTEPRPEAVVIRSDGDESAAEIVAAVAKTENYSIAVRGSGYDVVADRAVEIAIALPGRTYRLPLPDAAGLARSLLADGTKTKIGHGFKYAIQMLSNAGLKIEGRLVDLKICDYLLDPNNYNHELDGIAAKLRRSLEPQLDDAARTAEQIAELAPEILTKITEQGLDRVLFEVEMPLVPVLAGMEQEGVYVDAEFLDRYSGELDKQAKRIEAELYEAAGETFNINSPKQIQELIFEKLALPENLGLKRLKKTKSGYSTDESVLSKMAEHPVPRLILEYRMVTKLKNTYVDSLPQFINPKTQRIHATIGQTVAATGRLSCDRPNLQNIPMRTPLGRRIREAFRPQNPAEVLISADYSQVELRLLAHLAQAEGLIEAFRKNLDIHTVTAAKIFNLDPATVDPVMRSRAKAVNFGIIYGMGPQRLAQETGVSMTAAKEFISRYFEVYPGIRAYTDQLIESAKTLGYTTTIMGRRRPIPELRESSRVMAARGENIAVNAPIQGSAADLIKMAMIAVQRRIDEQKLRLRLLLQVHDELLFSCPAGAVEENTPIIRECMEHAIDTSVPLKVEIRSGKNWLEAHS